MTTVPKAPEPQRETPVANAVGALQESTKELALRVEALELVLKPVLSSQPDKSEACPDRSPPSCQLEDKLVSVVDHITAITLTLTGINGRIQL